jgi:hypothetical protein
LQKKDRVLQLSHLAATTIELGSMTEWGVGSSVRSVSTTHTL